MGKNYDLYSPYQRTIDNLKRRIRGYEKMKKDLTNQYRKSNKENQELKKQLQELEEQSVNAINKQVTKGIDLINREAEFMKWLKDSLDALEMCDREFILTNHKKEIKVYEDILGKYKEIIGKDINVSTK